MFSEKVINLSYLTELSKGDAGFIKEMVDIFLSENPEEIKRLEQAVAEIDFEKIRAISHHMKSTIPFMGLDLVIGNELIQIENLAIAKKEIENINTCFIKVKTVFEKAFQELSI